MVVGLCEYAGRANSVHTNTRPNPTAGRQRFIALEERLDRNRANYGMDCAAAVVQRHLFVMTPRLTVGLSFWIVVTSVVAGAQQRSDTGSPPPASTTVTERTYPSGGVLPLRRVERRTESGGRKILIETVETPGVEGTWEPAEEVVTTKTTTHTQQDVFQFDFDRQRKLAETTQSEETHANGRTRNVQRTWVADLDGRLTLSSRYVEETTVTSPGVRQSDATLSRLYVDGSLREAERRESTEQQLSSAVVRHDSTYLVRDPNGRWLPTETRSGEMHGIGSAERVEEETIQRQNLNGALVVSDKVVTRTSESNGENRVVIETYSQGAEGFVRSDSHLALWQRVRRSTTASADGGRNTVEEIEARNPDAPNDPMRIIRRTLVTVRSVAAGRWVTERQIFERDLNGRFVLVTHEMEDTTDK